MAATFVFLVVAGVIVGYFAGYGTRETMTTTSIITFTLTVATTQPTETFAVCTILNPSQGVTIRLTNATRPVAGATISVQVISTCWGGNTPKVVAQYDVTTNSSGWASMCGEDDGTCSLVIHYAGGEYPLSVSLIPGTKSVVSYDLSTGNETTR